MQGVNNEHTFTQDAMEITSYSVRLATWKEALLSGDQTHDGLDDCRDLRDIVAKVSQAEGVDMDRVIDTSEDLLALCVCQIYYIVTTMFHQDWQEGWKTLCNTKVTSDRDCILNKGLAVICTPI